MRICVFGAGSIGGNFAARLAEAGNEVSVVVRGAHLDAIRARGLTLLTGDRRIVVPVHASDRPPLKSNPEISELLKSSRSRFTSTISVSESRCWSPACSAASHVTSRSRRCCGSMKRASGSPMPKKGKSNPVGSSRNAPQRETERPGTPGTGS